MKGIFKKNQLIITSLAVMIAIAGYLNFSGSEISMVKSGGESLVESLKEEPDIPEGEIGEAVLTLANVESFVADARLSREQIHAKAKAGLESIIADEKIEKSMKQDAIDQLAKMTDRMEKQVAAEEMLGAKGFLHSVVTVNDDSVDVAVASEDLSAVAKAQIEDVVSRTCGCDLKDIVITKMNLSEGK